MDAGANEKTTLLIIRLGTDRFALPAGAVRRTVPMAAPVALPDAPHGVVGVLSLGGELLPIVDPRPLLGLPPVAPHPAHHLVVLDAGTAFLLWVDRADTVEALPPDALTTVDAVADPLASHLARLGDDHLAVLAPAAFDPGPFLRHGRGR